MANKRVLKKEIRRICGALAGECVLARLAIPGIDKSKLNELVYQLAELQESAMALIKIDFPGNTKSYPSKQAYAKARKEYFHAAYSKLRDHFNSRIQEIIKEMNATVPDASTPEARKEKMKHLLELGFNYENGKA